MKVRGTDVTYFTYQVFKVSERTYDGNRKIGDIVYDSSRGG